MKQRFALLATLVLLASCASPPEVIVLGPHQVRVQRGDTLSKIAHRHGISTQSLIRANRLRPPYKILAGQILVLPEEKAPPPPRKEEPITATPLEEPFSLERDDIRKEISSDLASSGKKEANKLAPPPELSWKKPRKEASAPTGVKGHVFAWPLRGKVLVKYGRTAKGRSDGIRIKAEAGAAIGASAAGKVIYANNEIKNLGNLVIVEHPGGWVTAYGHLDKIKVRVGDKVAAGQALGSAGKTGDVKESQLYFEVRRNKKAVDPEDFLG